MSDVGITNDSDRRAKEHGDRFSGGIVVVTPEFSRFDAKSIEQGFIELNPQFENKINSISPNNPKYLETKGIFNAYYKENDYQNKERK